MSFFSSRFGDSDSDCFLMGLVVFGFLSDFPNETALEINFDIFFPFLDETGSTKMTCINSFHS